VLVAALDAAAAAPGMLPHIRRHQDAQFVLLGRFRPVRWRILRDFLNVDLWSKGREDATFKSLHFVVLAHLLVDVAIDLDGEDDALVVGALTRLVRDERDLGGARRGSGGEGDDQIDESNFPGRWGCL